MKLTVDSLKNLTGIEILDEDEVLNDWKNVEIENPVVNVMVSTQKFLSPL